MIDPAHVSLMATYNKWQNESLFTASDGLSAADRKADQGAFFGSIEGTLNHLLWGDRIWMSRFADLPGPNVSEIDRSAEETETWDELKTARSELDRRIIDWAQRISTEDLSGDLSWYSGAFDAELTRPKWLLITHFFNHQTHHRGQVHAMLTAKGASPEPTDLPWMPSIR